MDTRLDPTTLGVLQSFGRRRRRLLLLRGIFAIFATLLAAMTLVAMLDYLLVLPDRIRLAFSILAYGVTLIVFISVCLRRILHRTNLRELALMLEQRREDFREQVLSAVELGELPKKKMWDSQVLRDLLQRYVARRIKDLSPRKLLPAAFVQRWALGAILIIALTISLFFIPQLQFKQLMVRAFAPKANLARVSQVQVKIIQPADPDALIPRGDPLEILIQVSGPQSEDEQAILEYFNEEVQPDEIIMQPVGERRFNSTLLVAKETLTYRIKVGDAVTRRYTVHSRPRPHVVRFHKTYRYPEYTQLDDINVTETHGDLKALKGSTVDLVLDVDQPIHDAELRIHIKDPNQRNTIIPLHRISSNQLKATVNFADSDDTYRVHLLAQETGFVNKFSPNYEIQALADLVPLVTLDKPRSDMIAPADEVINLRGTAQDDLNLKNVAQHIRLNESPWQQKILNENPGKKTNIHRDWDLLMMDLKPGDRITTKLTATDLMGNIGESPVVEILVSSSGFSTKRLEKMQEKRILQTALDKLSDTAEQLDKAGEKFKQSFESLRQDPDIAKQTQFNQDRVAAQAAAQELELRAAMAWAMLKEAARGSESRREGDDMVLLGRALSKLRHEALAQAEANLERPGAKFTEDLEAAKQQVEQAEREMNRVREIAQQMARAHENMLASMEGQNVAQDLDRLGANQDRMLEQAAKNQEKPELAERLARQEEAATREQALVEETLGHFAEHLENSGHARSAGHLQERLQKRREGVEVVLQEKEELQVEMENAKEKEREKKDKEINQKLAREAQEMRNDLKNVAKDFEWMKRTADQSAKKSRENLERMLGHSADQVAQVSWKAQDLANQEKKLAEMLKDSDKYASKLNEEMAKADKLTDEAEQRWDAAVEQLEDRAEMEEQRPQVDYPFVADTANVAKALEAIQAAASDKAKMNQAAESLRKIEKAYRTLETGHDVLDTKEGTHELAAQERWDNLDDDKAYQSALDWQHLETALKDNPKQVERAGLPKEIKQDLSKLNNSEPVRNVRDEMKRRDKEGEIAKNKDIELGQIGRELGEVAKRMQPHMDLARETIELYAPSIAEQVAGVEKLAEEVEQATEQLAQKTEEMAANEVKEAAEELLGQQERLNDRVDTVRDSIRRDANLQDLADDEGRERARDADDALAMLRQPPPKAEDMLRQAATSAQPQTQAHALDQAEQQQEKLEENLEMIGEHYANLEAGKPELTRPQLRQMEEQLGLRQPIDKQYQRIDQMAQMAQIAPEQLRRMLEAELAMNQAMQQELAQIAQNTLNNALDRMEESVKQEGNLSDRVDQIAAEQQQHPDRPQQLERKANQLEERAKQIAQKAEQLAETRIPQAAQKSQQAGAQAQGEFTQAQEATQSAAEDTPQEFSGQDPSELAEQMRDVAGSLAQANQDLQKAAAKTKAAAQKENAQPAREAATQAKEAGNQARDLAKEANNLARDLQNLDRQMAQQMGNTEGWQESIAQETGEIGDDVSRAAMHAERLDQPLANSLQESGQGIQELSDDEMGEAQEALASASRASSAQEPVEGAYNEATNQLEQLAEALANMPSMASSMQGTPMSPGEMSDMASQWMARALDQLDSAAQAQGQPAQQGQPGQTPGPSPAAQAAEQSAQQAMGQATQSQQAAMAQARAQSQNQQPGQDARQDRITSSEAGRSNPDAEAPYIGAGMLPEDVILLQGDWGKLRRRRAKDLMEAQKEAVSEDYKRMVNTYFKVISEKGKEKR
jgi:hypothetical protein